MDSCEIIKKAVSEKGVKLVADGMQLSASMIYKWCEPKQREADSGADNPLDRIAKLYELTGDRDLVAWLCQKAGCMCVANPDVSTRALPPIKVTQKMLKEFSDLLEAVSKGLDNDGKIDAKEADGIRSEWENLKTVTESFVYACEKGAYKS